MSTKDPSGLLHICASVKVVSFTWVSEIIISVYLKFITCVTSPLFLKVYFDFSFITNLGVHIMLTERHWLQGLWMTQRQAIQIYYIIYIYYKQRKYFLKFFRIRISDMPSTNIIPIVHHSLEAVYIAPNFR